MKQFAALLLLIIIVLVWGGSVLYCEILTDRYAEVFAEGYQAIGYISQPTAIKVLQYKKDSAKVYYKDDEGGYIVEFHTVDGEWKFKNWECIWSKMGSADGIVWPYIR